MTIFDGSASLKRIAWAYGCAKRGSEEESRLHALLLERFRAALSPPPSTTREPAPSPAPEAAPYLHAPQTAEEVQARCRQGQQWCHLCEDFNCCDNLTPRCASHPQAPRRRFGDLFRCSECGEVCTLDRNQAPSPPPRSPETPPAADVAALPGEFSYHFPCLCGWLGGGTRDPRCVLHSPTACYTEADALSELESRLPTRLRVVEPSPPRSPETGTRERVYCDAMDGADGGTGEECQLEAGHAGSHRWTYENGAVVEWAAAPPAPPPTTPPEDDHG